MSSGARKGVPRAASGSDKRRAVSPTAGDGVLGAGGAGSLIVIGQFITGMKLPAEVAAAAAPFVSLGITYLVALMRQRHQTRSQQRGLEEYELRVLEILKDEFVSQETKVKVPKEWEEMKVLSLTEIKQRVIESMSTARASASDR